MEDYFYTIGEIATICGISTKTLRHYDKLELLKPEYVDKYTDYRYYTYRQVITLNIITSLKNTGLSLQTIKEYLDNHRIDNFLEIMKKQREKVEKKIVELNKIKNDINYYINHIEELERMSNDKIELKYIHNRKILFERKRSPCNSQAIAARMSLIRKKAQELSISTKEPVFLIHHDHYSKFNPENADLEICIEINDENIDSSNIKSLSEGYYISTIHKGSYNTLIKGYQLLIDWIDNNNYNIIGKPIEIYHVSYYHTDQESNFITELQIPVLKTQLP